MSIDRPTYHESWYRIAPTRPRLRALVQSFRQRYRGQTWHVLRDPSANKFFRLHEATYRFVGLLDGRRTVEQAWRAVDEAFGDEAPTQGEVIQLLGQLYVSNLLTGDMPPDAAGLFERYRKRVRREVGGYLLNILFARIPIWDPDRLLNRWAGATGWLFGPLGIVLWLAVVAIAGWSLAGRWGQLIEEGRNVLAPSNLLTLYLATVLAKVLHELGHGFACKRFGRGTPGGGEVHTIGIMLIALIPMPYVDASSSWAFRNKWHRAFVGAAGMYVELALAAVAAMVWARTAPDAWVHQFTYNLMFIAGVSTVLFNGNPLIKFDGYYILSDLIEMPNLQQRSHEMFRYLWKKRVFGVRRPRKPTTSPTEAAVLLSYFVASFIYKVFISIAILLFVAGQLFFIGMLMAVGGIIGLVLAPAMRFVHYLLTSPELDRHRPRAIGSTLATAGLLIALLALPKLPDHGRALGVVEPVQTIPVYAQVEGVLDAPIRPMGPIDRRDVLLASLRNLHLGAQLEEAQARYLEVLALGRRVSDQEPAAAAVYHEQAIAAAEAVAEARRDLAQRRITASSEGLWIPAGHEDASGVPVSRGDLLGHLIDPDRLEIRVATDQYAGPRIAAHVPIGTEVELRPRGRPDMTFRGIVRRVLRAGQDQLPSESLSAHSGGDILVDASQEERDQAAQSYFLVVIEPHADDADRFAAMMRPGQRIVARFRWPDASLIQQVYLAARQVLQERLQI